MDLLADRFAKAYPKHNAGVGIHVESLRQDLLDDRRDSLLIFYAVVSLVLLLACANVANLLLARGASRRQEIAIRSCLGAGRFRIVGQLLTESLILAILGGALGVLLGVWGRDLLLAGIPNEIPAYFSFEINGWVVVILLIITMLSCLLFGLAPALFSTRHHPDTVLRGGVGRSTDQADQSRFRALLVCFEIGLAVLVLVAAGLMIRGFLQMNSMDPGFNAKNILTMEINLFNAGRREVGERITFFRRLIERIGQHPAVESVAAANPLPYVGWETAYELEDSRLQNPDQSLTAMDAVVTPGYFRTLEIPLLKGRDFNESDDAMIREPVVIVSDTFAGLNWPGEDPLGKRLRLRSAAEEETPWMEVIGVVGETRARTFSSPRGWIYYPHGQRPFYELILTIRTRNDPLQMIAQVKDMVWSVEPDLPLHWNRPLADMIRDRYWEPPVFSWIFSIFSALALTMALMGVYGVVAYSVSRRSKEFGIRISLGAKPRDILVLVLRQGGLLSIWGLTGGLAAAFVVMRIARGVFYGVSPTDPAVYGFCAILILVAVFLASLIPARRAARIDPATALHYE
jgi:putative ABC transport system permease protein